ncbi:testis-specific serine/threonine-protein kinase 4-like [Pocillopora verrucosa]|uniref:testis-specific serine/threonine-protein kinase 4-like n=1 Tax=Pocillopora verrucosa TaxID=203993 RepID=UPI00333F8D23
MADNQEQKPEVGQDNKTDAPSGRTVKTEKSEPSSTRAENPLAGVTALLERYGYQLGDILGKGSYAVVRKAYSRRHKRYVAVKIICKKKAPEDFLSKFLPREIKVLKKLHHPHVLSLIEVIETNTRMYIITDLAESGDLLEFIRKNGAVAEAQAKQLFKQLVLGITYVHSQDVVHRDLKCENLLLDKEKNLIVSDFGFARDNLTSATGKKKLCHTYCGSYAYAPPEILKGIAYDATLADVWSMGVILYTMVCGRLPFDDSNLRSLLQQVHRRVNFPSKIKIAEPVKAIIHKMLQWNLTERVTVEQLRTDPWLTEEKIENEVEIASS